MIDRPQLRALLGAPDAWPPDGRLQTPQQRHHDGFVEHTVALHVGAKTLPGILLRPTDATDAGAAVLYCHAHGNRYDIGASELMAGRPALQNPPYGPVLARAGYTVLCIDMPGFGDRQNEGSEDALAKAALWHGRTLLGQMLGDLSAALAALARCDDVDPDRIATLGISMGATHAWWLAALDDRVAACAHLCAFADIAPLIMTGAHDLHRPYLTIPGLMNRTDFGDIAARIAPRPQLVASGAQDPLTPADALNPALEKLRQAYDLQSASDQLTILTSPDTGHEETAEMRAEALAFLDRHLK